MDGNERPVVARPAPPALVGAARGRTEKHDTLLALSLQILYRVLTPSTASERSGRRSVEIALNLRRSRPLSAAREIAGITMWEGHRPTLAPRLPQRLHPVHASA